MNDANGSEELRFGPWRARRGTGELWGPEGVERLEPKVMELLFLLAARPDQAVSREELLQRLWPDVTVGEDALARAVFKLRKALGDEARAPRYIETLPKRGYRFLAQSGPEPMQPPQVPHPPPALQASVLTRSLVLSLVLPLVLGGGWALHRAQGRRPEAEVLTDRALDFYFQYVQTDNEAAIELFERVLARHPDHAPACAGLANALAQRVVRWPEGAAGASFARLRDALQHGHTRSPEARRQLARAQELAERAVRLAPRDPAAHKALGFVLSVREAFPQALAAYRRAVELDPDAWGPMINTGDLLEIAGRPEEALGHFESAFTAMTRVYPQQAARIRPWYAELALLIADRHRAQGRPETAEAWYRRVLEIAPFHEGGTRRLAELLGAQGRGAEAQALRARRQERFGLEARAKAAPGE